MTRRIAALFCPGRGSYGRDELGSIHRALRPGPVAEALDLADAQRRSLGLPALRDLDRADRFRPALHLDGRNAAELIYFATLAQVAELNERFEIAVVAGNSLGWYTALAASGCVDPVTGWELVATMAELQTNATGGQILTTTVDADWRIDESLARAVEEALAATRDLGGEHFVARSIRLGGHEVLAGSHPGIRELLGRLPSVVRGDRQFPFQLAGHGPFHTELCRDVANEAQQRLGHLDLCAPRIHLVDGRGDAHSPWSADPGLLLRYTLGDQVVTTFDFTAAVRTAIREFNPEVLLCAGPGTSLRAPVGHVAVRERYRGVPDRAALFASDLVV